MLRTTFDDVGGMSELKEEIRMKIIHPLKHADMFRAYGKAIGGGILMYGPPGCGKTHLARATAGEISAGFISVFGGCWCFPTALAVGIYGLIVMLNTVELIVPPTPSSTVKVKLSVILSPPP